MKYVFCFEVELNTGDVEFFNVWETDIGRAWMQVAMAYGARATAIEFQCELEQV